MTGYRLITLVQPDTTAAKTLIKDGHDDHQRTYTSCSRGSPEFRQRQCWPGLLECFAQRLQTPLYAVRPLDNCQCPSLRYSPAQFTLMTVLNMRAREASTGISRHKEIACSRRPLNCWFVQNPDETTRYTPATHSWSSKVCRMTDGKRKSTV